MRSKKIRLLVVDQHPIFRLGLMKCLHAEPDLVVVGEAATGDEALDMCRRLQPDIVTMDLRLSQIDGLQSIRTIRDEFPRARIILLSARAARKDVTRALRAGACAFLAKTVGREKLVGAIRVVHRG